jgi:hypothetical protein
MEADLPSDTLVSVELNDYRLEAGRLRLAAESRLKSLVDRFFRLPSRASFTRLDKLKLILRAPKKNVTTKGWT